MRQDIAQAMGRFNIKAFGNKGNIEKVEKKLNNDETVLYISPTNAIVYSVNTGKKNKYPGVVVITNQRVFFNYHIGLSEVTESLPMIEINSVNTFGNGISGGHIEVHTVTKTLDFLVNYKKEIINTIQSLIEDAIGKSKSFTQQPIHSEPEISSAAKEIEQLFELKNKGIISEEEFETKKKQLLGL